MRVVHTCLRYPPALGGVESYVKELVERTRNPEAGLDARVLTSKMRTHGPVSELAAKDLLDDPPYVQRLKFIGTPLVSYPRLQSLKYYLAHHKPDLIHGYSFWYQPADVAARYALKHNVPFIFHPMYYENKVREKIRWRLYKQTVGRKTFEAANVVVVISPYERSLIERNNFPVKRFELIPPGVEMNEFENISRNIFLSRKIRGRIILAVSRIAEGKGLADIVSVLPQILNEVDDVKLVLVGEDFGYKSELESMAASLGVADKVVFTGKLKRKDLVAAYTHADVFVHPSHYEAFGIVLAEAQAAGTPVVARNCTAIPFAAPNGVGGLLFDDREGLVKNIVDVLKNSDLSEKLGRQGHVYVKDNFSWDAAEKKLANLYSEFGRKK